MKSIFIFLLALFAAYQGLQAYQHRSLVSAAVQDGEAYVVVYGRNSCAWTKQMRKQLTRDGIRFDYRIVDESLVADHLHQKMHALGMSTRRYNLPVVEVNGQLLIRPKPETVEQLYDGG